MTFEEFEKQVEKIVEDYMAPENITDEIKNFLFESGNLYSIFELSKEVED